MTVRPLVIAGDRLSDRRDALLALGVSASDLWAWNVWQTTTGAWSARLGRVVLAADPWCTPEDWSCCCGLLRMAGWYTGDRVDDIGSPTDDIARAVWIWDLTLP
jgi:hypothetical protein